MEYCVDWNATKAAIRAGYSERSARSIASELLAKPNIQAVVSARKAEYERICELRIMGPMEVIANLTDIARNDIGDFLDENGVLDLKKIKDSGKSAQVKSVKQTFTINPETGTPIVTNEVTMYSRHDALRDLAKHHGLMADKLTITLEPQRVAAMSDEEIQKALEAATK